MTYTVNRLANLAGVSVRTLHHYDAVGLLKPAAIRKNGYREYGEAELLKLQQILFFRELDIPLEEIGRYLASPHFDLKVALRSHRRLLELKKKRLEKLLKTVDKTLSHVTHKSPMEDKELYDAFTDEDMKNFAEEARERWGHTDVYQQSVERTKGWTKEDKQRVTEDGERFTKELAALMPHGPKSDVFQAMIAKHYESIKMFYEPTLEIYRGLANMYVDDPRFSVYYDKHAPGLAKCMKEAMLYFADKQEGKV